MTQNYSLTYPSYIALAIFILLFSNSINAQVGIGTTTPKEGAILDVDSPDKGMYVPRLNISNPTSLGPITGITNPANAEGLLIYNTNTTIGPGLFFWSGAAWDNVANTSKNLWKMDGNAGTTAGTNFIGTTDNMALRFKTASTNAFEISGGNATNRGKLRALTNGTAALPVYSFGTSPITGINTGMFQAATNAIGFSTNSLERLRISTDGSVGINTASPSSRLQIVESLNTNGALYGQITNPTSNWAALEGYNPNIVNGAGSIGTGFYGVVGLTNDIVNGWAGYFAGDVRVTNTLYANNFQVWSDRRVKQNIRNFNNALNTVLSLKPAVYEKNVQTDSQLSFESKKELDQKSSSVIEYGLIAQDVELILPELVSEKKVKLKDLGEINLKSVNYVGLIPILTQAIQEQQAVIDSQENRIARLESFVEQLVGKK